MKPILLNKLTSEEMLIGLKSRDRQIIKYIYRKNFPSVELMVHRNSGNDTDADDIFQDAMLIMYKKAVEGELHLSCTFETYLYAVCKNLWHQRLQKKNQLDTFQDEYLIENHSESGPTEDLQCRSEMFRILHRNLEKLDEKSREVLSLYLNSTSHKETAQILGYSTEKYVKTKKFLIKERLRKFVMHDPGYQKLMLDMAE